MATATVKAEGKSGFLKEFFVDHPDAGKAAIDEAWQEAGNGDTISISLISKIRKDLGLTGKGQSKTKMSKGAGKRSSAAPKSKGGSTGLKASSGTAARANGRLDTETLDRPAQRQSPGEDRTTLLIRLEGEIDDMLHEIRVAGGLPEFTETLKKARRILVRSHDE